MESSVWMCLSDETHENTEPIVGDLSFMGGREACVVRGSHRKPAGFGELNQQVGERRSVGRRGCEKQDHKGPHGGFGLHEVLVVVQNEKGQLLCGLL